MTIETTLSKDQFIRLAILRHIQRKTFYFYAAIGAAVTAFAIVRGGEPILFALAWVPFLFYMLPGVIGPFRQSRDINQPLFQPTRYEFSKEGVAIKNKENESQLDWSQFSEWKTIAQCYVLYLIAGPILAIPQADVPVTQRVKFEDLLERHINKKGPISV